MNLPSKSVVAPTAVPVRTMLAPKSGSPLSPSVIVPLNSCACATLLSRNKPAIAEKINQVAILTSDGFYILDIEKRKTLFFDQQTEFRDLAEIPTQDKFIIADYDQIGTFDKNHKTEFINLEFGIARSNILGLSRRVGRLIPSVRLGLDK